MQFNEAVSYFGPALAYAMGLVAIIAVIGALTGRRVSVAVCASVFWVALFLILTQHPFPDLQTLNCATLDRRPELIPFSTFPRITAEVEAWTARELLSNRTFQAAVMNIVLCVIIGVSLSRHLRSVWPAFFAGLAMSLLAETSQLTGFFGVFPCPYRLFDVDDLIFNVGGVVVGYLLARGFGWGRARASDKDH